MNKRMIVLLSFGILGVLLGVILTVIGVTPGIIPALIAAISGAWIAVVIFTKGGASIRDEMVVQIEHISAYYALNATLWFLFVLAGVHFFSLIAFSISDLLLALLIFMSLSNLLIRYFLLKRGKAE